MSRIKPLYDNIRLNALIVSDTHIDEKHPTPVLPMHWLWHSVKDAQYSVRPMDAYITVGDTTSRGSRNNWLLAEKVFRGTKPADRIILTIGNHDTWNDDGFDAAISNYFEFVEKITGKKREKVYYSEIINGYYFIFIGTDAESGCEANLSDEEMMWFAAEMEKAGQSGKPIFVFCHQSLNGRHGLPRTWDAKEDPNADPMDGGIGERSDEVAAILKKYKNVYYFSGHSHMGLGGEKRKESEGYSTIEKEDDLRLINLPSLACGNHHCDDKSMGIGVVLEVYDDKVVLRPRKTATHSWNNRVAIQNGKMYFEDTID